MPNNQQQQQNEPRRAQPGDPNPADGSEDMERPDRAILRAIASARIKPSVRSKFYDQD